MKGRYVWINKIELALECKRAVQCYLAQERFYQWWKANLG